MYEMTVEPKLNKKTITELSVGYVKNDTMYGVVRVTLHPEGRKDKYYCKLSFYEYSRNRLQEYQKKLLALQLAVEVVIEIESRNKKDAQYFLLKKSIQEWKR